jgi:CubicO group peptidase (beta-lactamase class C family)
MRHLATSIAISLVTAAGLHAAAQVAPATTAKLDEVASRYYKADEPGAAVLVLRDGKPILRKAYGMADLEQAVRMRPEHVLEIGSITKQFTAMAILQLVEQGKIGLGDEITKFLPDYPTQGKKITIEHLLTHTSGIQDVTEMASFPSTMRQDVTPQEIIDRFKNEPMEFAPGTKWKYDNSGYVLLGAILEKVSGQSYGDYLRKHVFPPAGLTNTAYGDLAAIIPGRVRGYERENGHVVNADYLSMTVPFAAGALVSTVDDLAKWTDAVATGKLVSSSLVQHAWSSARLNDGSATGYGYGWIVGNAFGTRVIQHDGNINGFSSAELWMPDEKVFVAVLTNLGSGGTDTTFVANQLASYAIGRPFDPVAITLPAGRLQEYTGVYRADDKTTRTISLENGQLFSQRSGGARAPLEASGSDVFFIDLSLTTFRFERNASGKVIAMTVDPVLAPSSRAVRTEETAPIRKEIAVDPKKLDRYVGRYELAPGFVLEVTRRGDTLWTQATGQESVQIFAESEANWFLRVVDAQLTFAFDADGKATSLTLHQGGREMPAKRLP